MNLYSFSVLGFSFGVTLISLLALVKRRDVTSFRFLFFSISVCGWGYLFSIWINQNFDLSQALFLTRLSHAFAVFIPITWLHFVFEFIEKKEPVRYFYLVNYLIAVCLAFLTPTPLFVSGMHSILEFEFYTSHGPAYHVFTLLFSVIVPYGLISLIAKWRASDGVAREQLKYLTWGTIAGFISGATTFIPIYYIPFPLWLLPLMTLYPAFTGIALIRYGLFDAQQIADAFQREKITALGIMAASLNHEMRNPLYIAKSKIEVYQDARQRQTFPDEVKSADETIGSVAKQLDRTLDIMQRFSDFARPVSLTRKERIAFDRLFRDVLDLVSYEIQKNSIAIKTSVEKDVSLFGHRRQLEEVLVNLMINAGQAMKSGGEIKVKAVQINGKTIIEIEDNGPGIAEENQKHIFEPFFSTKANRGSGLGLYITKQLVEKNGGKISVKSKATIGTKFSLEFGA